MINYKKRLILALKVFFFLSLISFFSCQREEPYIVSLRTEIIKASQYMDSTNEFYVIDFGKVFDFKWDTVYFFTKLGSEHKFIIHHNDNIQTRSIVSGGFGLGEDELYSYFKKGNQITYSFAIPLNYIYSFYKNNASPISCYCKEGELNEEISPYCFKFTRKEAKFIIISTDLIKTVNRTNRFETNEHFVAPEYYTKYPKIILYPISNCNIENSVSNVLSKKQNILLHEHINKLFTP